MTEDGSDSVNADVEEEQLSGLEVRKRDNEEFPSAKRRSSDSVDGSVLQVDVRESEITCSIKFKKSSRIVPDADEPNKDPANAVKQHSCSDPMTFYADKKRLCVEKKSKVLLRTNLGFDECTDCETKFVLEDVKTDENYGIKGQLRTVQGSKVGVCIPDNGRGRAKLKVLNGNEVKNTKDLVLTEAIVNKTIGKPPGTTIYYPVTDSQCYFIVPSQTDSASVDVELNKQQQQDRYRRWSHDPQFQPY